MSEIITTPPTNVPPPPNPRRIVLSHDSQTGAPLTIDSPTDMITGEGGQRFCTVYTQKDFIGKPELAMEGATRKPDEEFIQSMGISAGFIDIAPGQEFKPHFCNSVDYLIAVKGEVELGLIDGTWKIIKAGDMIVGFAAANLWRNKTNEWCRFAVVAVPCYPQLVQGKTLDQEPVKAFKIA